MAAAFNLLNYAQVRCMLVSWTSGRDEIVMAQLMEPPRLRPSPVGPAPIMTNLKCGDQWPIRAVQCGECWVVCRAWLPLQWWLLRQIGMTVIPRKMLPSGADPSLTVASSVFLSRGIGGVEPNPSFNRAGVARCNQLAERHLRRSIHRLGL